MFNVKRVVFNSKLPNMMLTSMRSEHKWNKDWMPGPYPTTQAEREAAAKKYNLLPEEYEPTEDLGDYPKLPLISAASKDPHYYYDYPALKKDYGETMHELQYAISEDRWDCNWREKQRIPVHIQTLYYIASLLVFFVPNWLLWDHKVSLPHAKKHYPEDGPHYKYP